MTRLQPCVGRSLHDILEPPPNPIALDRVADLFRDGKSYPDRALVGASQRLQHESRRRHFATAGRCQKIGAPPQSLHGRTRRRATGVRRSVACDRARAGPPPPCGRRWSPCGRGNHAGACAPACSVDRSASRLSVSAGRRSSPIDAIDHCSRRTFGRWPSTPERPRCRGCGLFKVRRLIREAGLARQCEPRSRDRRSCGA